MSGDYKGGNSRQLAKALDGLDEPLAVLDRKGSIVFVNRPLCQLMDMDATKLVGKQVSWDVAPDDGPLAALLTGMAPPATSRSGQITQRRLSAPLVAGTELTSQVFMPFADDDGIVQMTLVLLGTDSQLASLIPTAPASSLTASAEQCIASIRARWSQMDEFHALLGESPEIQLAMRRSQLLVTNHANYLVFGPESIGKTDVSQGVFVGRLRAAGIPEVSGQLFPIDCKLLDTDLLEGLLDVFAGRLRPDAPRAAQHLLLQRVDCLKPAALGVLLNWLSVTDPNVVVSATSVQTMQELKTRGEQWKSLLFRIAETEVHIPSLQERRQDILPLANHFLAECCRRAERSQMVLESEAIELLTAYAWPRNISELRAAMEHVVAQAVLTKTIQPAHLPVEIRTFPGTLTADTGAVEPIELDAVLKRLEFVILQRALKAEPNNRAQVARLLGISRPRLLRLLQQHGLDQQ